MEEQKIKPWQNELDTKKYLVDVHMAFKKYLGTDFKLAKLDDKEREFIFTMVPAAIGIFDLCPNKVIAKQIMEMDMAYVNTLAILKFNVDGNMIVNKLTVPDTNESEEEDENNFLDKLRKRIQGESKPKQIEE